LLEVNRVQSDTWPEELQEGKDYKNMWDIRFHPAHDRIYKKCHKLGRIGVSAGKSHFHSRRNNEHYNPHNSRQYKNQLQGIHLLEANRVQSNIELGTLLEDKRKYMSDNLFHRSHIHLRTVYTCILGIHQEAGDYMHKLDNLSHQEHSQIHRRLRKQIHMILCIVAMRPFLQL